VFPLSPELSIPVVAKPFWFRRPLHQKFSAAAKNKQHGASSANPAKDCQNSGSKQDKTPVSINKSQTHGAILLPLRLRSNGMPLLIVNTHLNCNVFHCFVLSGCLLDYL
jgi:hypothetical protein